MKIFFSENIFIKLAVKSINNIVIDESFKKVIVYDLDCFEFILNFLGKEIRDYLKDCVILLDFLVESFLEFKVINIMLYNIIDNFIKIIIEKFLNIIFWSSLIEEFIEFYK